MASDHVEEVRSLLRLHDVSIELSTSWGLEYVQYCPSCGYIDEEFHTERIVVEYLKGPDNPKNGGFILTQVRLLADQGIMNGGSPVNVYRLDRALKGENVIDY